MLLPFLTGSWRNFDPTRGLEGFKPFIIPVALAVFPLAFRQLKIPAGLLMLAFSLVVLSVGILYLPCAVLMLWPEKQIPVTGE